MATTPVERFRAARRDPGLAVLEGFHALKHAQRFGAEILEIATPDAPRLRGLAAELAPDLLPALAALRTVTHELFRQLTPTVPREPVVALARRRSWQAAPVLAVGEAPLVFLEDPRNPGNIGAVVRVAAAAGAAGVLTTGEHDPWTPRALRGSAGLHYALPVLRLSGLPVSPRPLVALHPGGEPLRPGLIPAGALLAFGSERRGLSAGLLERAVLRVAIPMRPGVSSLNLAAAVAVALYG
jgi:TrmH family RNA methyltransferase